MIKKSDVNDKEISNINVMVNKEEITGAVCTKFLSVPTETCRLPAVEFFGVLRKTLRFLSSLRSYCTWRVPVNSSATGQVPISRTRRPSRPSVSWPGKASYARFKNLSGS